MFIIEEDVPYYPMAVISSFRTSIRDEKTLDCFIDQMKEGISLNWKELRNKIIKRLLKGTDLWKRFILSFDQVIHFTFLCPSIDRELIDALHRNNYRISGVMQLLASTSPAYDETTINQYFRLAKKTLSEFE